MHTQGLSKKRYQYMDHNLTRELHNSKAVSWYQTMGELYGSGPLSPQHTLLPDSF